MINKVYIVLYNDYVSQECYDTEEKAIEFIETRSYNPKQDIGWKWIDNKGNMYKIKELIVK